MNKDPKQLVTSLRTMYLCGKTRSIDFRISQLEALLKMYTERQNEIINALYTDLRKPKQESVCLEIDMLKNDVKNLLYNIREWSKPDKPSKEFANILDGVYIYKDPYGVVLVMGAWNYPIQLTMMPVAGAIAAGNCVVIKPSELSTASEKFLAQYIPQYLDQECYQVFCGGPVETTELLKERFDYIFYTGSTTVGKIVQTAAAKYLTPTTLELGGKSPAYIDSSANVDVAAHRILWGKLINAGQTCVAPDYVLCNADIAENFKESFKKVVKEFFGDDPKQSKDYGRIINNRHFKRLTNLLNNAEVAVGGESDAEERYMAPTLLLNVSKDDPIMQEEIFGPILPVVYVDSAYQALTFIKTREKPLAMYLFSNNSLDIGLFLGLTSSGGVCVNDVIMHLAVDTLPFGGVGQSGMGAYHGKNSFDTFTHAKSVLYKDLGWLGEKLSAARYPPYSDGKIAYLEFMLGKRAGLNLGVSLSHLIAFVIGLSAMYFGQTWMHQ